MLGSFRRGTELATNVLHHVLLLSVVDVGARFLRIEGGQRGILMYQLLVNAQPQPPVPSAEMAP